MSEFTCSGRPKASSRRGHRPKSASAAARRLRGPAQGLVKMEEPAPPSTKGRSAGGADLPAGALLSGAVSSNGAALGLNESKLLLRGLLALKKGEFGLRLPDEWTGLAGKVADAFNQAMETNQRMARELQRLSRVVGKEGKIQQRGSLGDVGGAWDTMIGCVNTLIEDLVYPSTETARVIGGVAKGDLSQTMALESGGRPLEGEFLRTARTVNTMVEQLGSFASEVT